MEIVKYWVVEFFIFTPIWGRFPFWRIFFKPPTRIGLGDFGKNTRNNNLAGFASAVLNIEWSQSDSDSSEKSIPRWKVLLYSIFYSNSACLFSYWFSQLAYAHIHNHLHHRHLHHLHRQSISLCIHPFSPSSQLFQGQPVVALLPSEVLALLRHIDRPCLLIEAQQESSEMKPAEWNHEYIFFVAWNLGDWNCHGSTQIFLIQLDMRCLTKTDTFADSKGAGKSPFWGS